MFVFIALLVVRTFSFHVSLGEISVFSQVSLLPSNLMHDVWFVCVEIHAIQLSHTMQNKITEIKTQHEEDETRRDVSGLHLHELCC